MTSQLWAIWLRLTIKGGDRAMVSAVTRIRTPSFY
jgi:hypothetical protein